jgi:putative flippase GtrA
MDQVVVIPVIDPGEELLELVEGLRRVGFHRFIVVDDGSDTAHQDVFGDLAVSGIDVRHQGENLGKGAAIKAGLRCALDSYPDAPACITVDGDGQHIPADVRSVCEESSLHPDELIIGERDLHDAAVPLRSRIGNGFSALYFKLDTGVSCADTQTGLRCLPAALMPFALQVPGNRYDYEMNFLTEAVKAGLGLRKVSIATVYLDENRASHFDTVHDSILIYRSLIRFALSSMACAILDLGLFGLLVSVLGMGIFATVAIATIAGRMTSGALNFALNRRWSFRATGDARAQMMRYIALFTMQMVASMLLVSLFGFLPVPLVIVKVFVDSALFVISYFAQRNWVFRAADGEAVVERNENAVDAHISGAASEASVSMGVYLRDSADGVRRVRSAGCFRGFEGPGDGRPGRHQQHHVIRF